MIKIHLQVVLEAMAPPIIGPSSNARALDREILETNLGVFSGGTSSMIRIVQSEKDPPPPTP